LPVSAFDKSQCDAYKFNGVSLPHTQVSPHYLLKGKMFAEAWSVSCSDMTDGDLFIFLEGTNGPYFKMQPINRRTGEITLISGVTGLFTDSYYVIDGDALGLKAGKYQVGGTGFKDESGKPNMMSDRFDRNGKLVTFDFKPTTPDSPTTSSPPDPRRPEVLDDQLVARVWNSKSASVSYTATVRCSSVCGTLPENFAAKLCEVGTSYMSPTCIATTRPFQIGKANKTKLGAVNTFVGTFIIEKNTTGKKYKAYLNIPAGKKQPTTLGLETFIWNGKSSFKYVPSSITVPMTTVAPGATTTTNAGTSPTTTSNVTSSAALTVTSDSVSGKNSLTVTGNGAAVKIEATIKCSGQCTKLPNSILGRLCKVGTSYTDASCTSIITPPRQEPL